MDFKNRYIVMRNKKEYNLDFFFNYYLSQGGKVKDGNEFVELFLYTHQIFPNGMKMVTGEIDKQEVLKHMDGVFGLTTVFDNHGNFVKVVE